MIIIQAAPGKAGVTSNKPPYPCGDGELHGSGPAPMFAPPKSQVSKIDNSFETAKPGCTPATCEDMVTALITPPEYAL
jgi:hypothetical protein